MKKVILSAVLFIAAVSFGSMANAQSNTTSKKVDNKECCQKKCDKVNKDAKCKDGVKAKDCKDKKKCAKKGTCSKKSNKPSTSKKVETKK